MTLTNPKRYRMEGRLIKCAPDDSEPYYAEVEEVEALNGEWVKWEDVKPLLRAAAEPSEEPDYRHLYECEKASKAVMQCEMDSLKADLHAVTNVTETLEALKTAHQALLEVAHAQDAGPEWYTRGASGLRQQVAMWVRRGLDALNKARPTERTGASHE